MAAGALSSYNLISVFVSLSAALAVAVSSDVLWLLLLLLHRVARYLPCRARLAGAAYK